MTLSRAVALGAGVLVAGLFSRSASADDCHEHRHAHPHPAAAHHHHDHAHPHPGFSGHHHPFPPGDAMTPQCHERPVIVAIEPSSGPPGTVVRLTGRFFTVRDRVFIGHVEQTAIERLPNRITVQVVPGSRSGRFRVEGQYTIESPVEYRVTEAAHPPLVNRLAPTAGPPGTEVVITGQNFSSRAMDNQVLIGDRPLTIRSASVTEIRVIIPEGTQSGPVTVRVPGAGEGLSQQPFTVTRPLIITDFQPRLGGVNTEVEFRGTGIPVDPRQIRVSLGGRTCRVVAATPATFRAIVPAGASSGRFDVSVPLGGRVETSWIFTVTTPPQISRLLPPAGPPGAVIVVLGAHFGVTPADVTVQVSGRPAALTGAAPVTDRQIAFTVPPGAGTGPVTVTVRGQGSAISPAPFEVLEPLTIADFAPHAAAPGSEVVIRGSGFVPSLRGQTVNVASRACRVIAATATELRVVLPTNAITGVFEIEIRGRAAVRSATPLQVMTPPVISRFEPVAAVPGADITIYGENLGTTIPQVRVTLAGRPCVLRSVGSGQVVVQLPAGAVSGKLQIQVEGQGSAETARDLEVLVPITVASFTPASAPPGALITIAGTGFSPTIRNNTVRLGGRTQRVTAASATELQVVIAAGTATGRFQVSVRGRETVESAATFTVDAAVLVGDFSPRSGPVGSEVIVRGRGFDAAGGMRVTIGGRNCTILSVTPAELRVQIPPGATTAPLRVSVRGVGEAETRDAFTVAATIAALSVASMEIVVMPGRTPGRVRLRGSGFGGDPRGVRVTVGTHEVSVVLLTPDTCEFLLPASVTGNLGRVRLRVHGVGEAEAPMDLVIGAALPPAPQPPQYRQPPPPARGIH
ncbi:MAG: IPT/TIG domain-containing protein [Deltaproteobacteria bacterium]|nr:IPT/TIG domain-containing protein [Deltaproteobacteria bacterium]